MRAPPVLMLIACVVVGAGCGASDAPTGATTSRVVVPNLKGKSERDALCQLQGLGLRWRFGQGRGVESRPPSGCGDNGVGSSFDDIPVTGQVPRPGARVRRGAVMTLEDLCTAAAREGKGCG